MIKVAPSMLAADYMNLGAEIDKVIAAGADVLHFDVMDGSFVPDITCGQSVLRQASQRGIDVDVHLMIVDPEKHIAEFAAAGAWGITVHAEASHDLKRDLRAIRAAGCRAGVSIKPDTPVEAIEDVIAEADLVLVMTVEPGKGGQKLLPFTLDKVRRVRALAAEKGVDLLIEVDGGINLETAAEVIAAGANMLVAGTAFFRSSHPEEFVKNIKARG